MPVPGNLNLHKQGCLCQVPEEHPTTKPTLSDTSTQGTVYHLQPQQHPSVAQNPAVPGRCLWKGSSYFFYFYRRGPSQRPSPGVQRPPYAYAISGWWSAVRTIPEPLHKNGNIRVIAPWYCMCPKILSTNAIRWAMPRKTHDMYLMRRSRPTFCLVPKHDQYQSDSYGTPPPPSPTFPQGYTT